jgi:hypothetical protein
MTLDTAEHRRLAEAPSAGWHRWGTYLGERSWGTVREDYSRDGSAWQYFPHDHARSRAYRWSEDGIAGFCDSQQHLCLAVALWNEKDPILKERFFGLTNHEGNHGEDVKEYYFYLDNTPTHSYAKILYKYPQVAYPYETLLRENARRGTGDPEFELFDAIGEIFQQQRYFDVLIEYAKVTPEDVVCRISVTNRGPDTAPIRVLPHIWYRNTWAWDHDSSHHLLHHARAGAARTSHPELGARWWYVQGDDGTKPELLFTENNTNMERLFGVRNETPFVKDGINDAVVGGYHARVNKLQGSKAAAHVALLLDPGETRRIYVRLTPEKKSTPFLDCEEILDRRIREANEFYASIHAPHLNDDERLVQRQAFAGLLWSKQFYHYDGYRWLEGDPKHPSPPEDRRHGRNRDWSHVYNADVILMPDKWEYPWFASWDLAFQCVVMAMIDTDFAKEQIKLLTTPRYQHPYGTIPAYEWDFNAVNPPVIAWAAWQVYQMERGKSGTGDVDFLAAVFQPLVMMLSWWLNRKDKEGKGIFGGGFLGLDNIGVFDRDQPLPTGGSLEQSDGTGWMATFQLHMMEIALELSVHDNRYLHMLQRFGQDFVLVANALQKTAAGGTGLWDEEAQFYCDVIRLDSGQRVPVRIHSIAGLVPLFAGIAINKGTLAQPPELIEIIDTVTKRRPYLKEVLASWDDSSTRETNLLSVVHGERLKSILERVLDENHFLSSYGVRRHRETLALSFCPLPASRWAKSQGSLPRACPLCLTLPQALLFIFKHGA